MPARLSDVRILIAEDNPVNQKVALFQLQKLGYLADVVDNGRRALEALARTHYDVVFMDCQMPELDGYETTHDLRAIEGDSRHTWIIAMTANSLEGDREKCLQAGMDDYVSKPVKPETLQAAINRFAGLRAVEQENREVGFDRGHRILSDRSPSFRDLEGGKVEESILGKLDSLTSFVDNTPKVIAEARDALARKMSPLVERAAHTLKGSCSNFGAERMRAACQALELIARDGALDKAADADRPRSGEWNSALFSLALEREKRRLRRMKILIARRRVLACR